MRRLPRAGAFTSELRFLDDGPVLPTYLPVEEGAAAALGAAALAAADLYEARTGRSQRVDVRQSGSGLMTASYLYMYSQPSGEWKGCHGYDQTIAAEGSVKPQRKAYECKDGEYIFLHVSAVSQRESHVAALHAQRFMRESCRSESAMP